MCLSDTLEWGADTDGRYLAMQGVAQILGGQLTQWLLQTKKKKKKKKKKKEKKKIEIDAPTAGANAGANAGTEAEAGMGLGAGSRQGAGVEEVGRSSSNEKGAVLSPRSFSLLAGWACVLQLGLKAVRSNCIHDCRTVIVMTS